MPSRNCSQLTTDLSLDVARAMLAFKDKHGISLARQVNVALRLLHNLPPVAHRPRGRPRKVVPVIPPEPYPVSARPPNILTLF